MVLGDAASKLETLVWNLNDVLKSIKRCFKVLKEPNVVKRPTSTVSFM